jgi:hypothetical protein
MQGRLLSAQFLFGDRFRGGRGSGLEWFSGGGFFST